jgi:hypothetical protein
MESTSTYQASPALQSNNTDMSVKDWMITLLIMFIPLVNIIMLFVWAFGGDVSKPSRTNWAKAGLLWALIMLVLYFVVFVAFFGAIMSAAGTSF